MNERLVYRLKGIPFDGLVQLGSVHGLRSACGMYGRLRAAPAEYMDGFALAQRTHTHTQIIHTSEHT